MNIDPKNTGLPLCAPLVRAVLDGKKTSHRIKAAFEAVVPGYNLEFSGLTIGHYHVGIPESGTLLLTESNEMTHPLDCPYGLPGSQLWVQEEWTKYGGQISYREDGDWIADFAQGAPDEFARLKAAGLEPKWLPASELPERYARARLKITSARVERLKDITAEQAIAEGLVQLPDSDLYAISYDETHAARASKDPREVYFWLWALCGGAWKANPWVWVMNLELKTNEKGETVR